VHEGVTLSTRTSVLKLDAAERPVTLSGDDVHEW
jgi:hypothetical protein